MEVFRKSKTVSAILKRSDSLLESFFIIFTDTHNLADSAHLGTKPVLCVTEFLKSPTGELHHHIIA